MYAVIESGGKQYRVAVGDRVKVESLRADPGTEVQLERVLLVADGDQVDVGSPYTGAVVSATVVEHGRGRKIRILKLRRRQNSRQRAGHRQNYTELEITGIGATAPGAETTKTAEAEHDSVAPQQQAPSTEAAAEVPAEAVQQPGEALETTAKDGDDDLTRLTGVGPVLAEKLRDAGVTSLMQIAGWTAEDVARIGEALNIEARIERDDWVGQAKKLIEKSG